MTGASVDVMFVVTDAQTTVFLEPIACELRRRNRTCAVIANFGARAPSSALLDCTEWTRSLAMHRRPAPLSDLGNLLRLTAAIRRTRPSVVHVSTPKAGLLGTIAARLGRHRCVVYQVRGFRAERTLGVSGWFARLLERLSIRLADHVVLNSESLRSALVAARVVGDGRGIVIGRGGSVGVDTDRFAPLGVGTAAPPSRVAGARPLTVGFVGRLHPDKGLADLVEVVRRMREVDPSTRVLVVGGWDDESMRHSPIAVRLEELGAEITGFVDDVVPHLQRMDLLLFPSIREGLPNAPLEAQACEVPVVGYRATGVVDAVADDVGGRLVELGDVVALASAAIELASDVTLRSRLGRDGRRFVRENFDRRMVVDRNVDFIETLLTTT